MNENINKILELVNSRDHKEQSLGKLMMTQLTLSEAMTICNTAIKARGLHEVKFLFDMFDPRTYPVKRSKHILQWSKIEEWAKAYPDQAAVVRKDRTWDLSTEVKYKVCKVVVNTREPWVGERMILAQYGKFVKETKEFYVFDTFKVGRVTLMSIDPVKS